MSDVSPESADRFTRAIALIDAANGEDPRLVDVGNARVPEELLYSQRMTAWLDRLYPNADEALRLAARAQHIRRWTIPRSDYPMDRAGYHKWRSTLYGFHADTAAAILREAGYDEELIARVSSLLRKQRLKADPLSQALEDVACLVFLNFEFAEFAARHEPEKVVGILRRTWAKMSPTGHAAALKLSLPSEAAELIKRALAP